MNFDDYDPIDINDYLIHYGRKGMKWYEHIFGRLQSHAKYMNSKGSKKEENLSKSISRRKVKKLSTDDLKTRIERLRVEKEYLDLSKETRTRGKIVTDKILDSVGNTSLNIVKRSIEDIGKQYLTYLMGTKINKKVGKDIINVANPKKEKKDK